MQKISITSNNLVYLLENLPKNIPSKKECFNNSILFTGAGFLTTYMLNEIVKHNTFNKIYVIVRNYSKFINNLKKINIELHLIPNLVIILKDINDISINNFPDVEYVIHNAAEIHAIKTIKQLYNSNIINTNKLVQIYKNQKFIFISSLSVFVSSNLKGNHIPETLPTDNVYSLYGGYAQSKFLGEKIIEKNIKNYQIIRLGLLTGSTTEGHLQKDFLHDFIYYLNTIGVAPNEFDESFVDFTPVDLAAQKILENFKNHTSIIHIANKKSIALSSICKNLSLKTVNKNEFLHTIKKLPTTIFYLMYFAFFKTEAKEKYSHYFNVDLFQSTYHWYEIQNEFIITNNDLINLYIKSIIKE